MLNSERETLTACGCLNIFSFWQCSLHPTQIESLWNEMISATYSWIDCHEIEINRICNFVGFRLLVASRSQFLSSLQTTFQQFCKHWKHIFCVSNVFYIKLLNGFWVDFSSAKNWIGLFWHDLCFALLNDIARWLRFHINFMNKKSKIIIIDFTFGVRVCMYVCAFELIWILCLQYDSY